MFSHTHLSDLQTTVCPFGLDLPLNCFKLLRPLPCGQGKAIHSDWLSLATERIRATLQEDEEEAEDVLKMKETNYYTVECPLFCFGRAKKGNLPFFSLWKSLFFSDKSPIFQQISLICNTKHFTEKTISIRNHFQAELISNSNSPQFFEWGGLFRNVFQTLQIE